MIRKIFIISSDIYAPGLVVELDEDRWIIVEFNGPEVYEVKNVEELDKVLGKLMRTFLKIAKDNEKISIEIETKHVRDR